MKLSRPIFMQAKSKMSIGNNIISYYLGTMLTQAGIPNSKTQLEIVRPQSKLRRDRNANIAQNMVLSAWSLICALIGCSLMEKAGRKTMCLIACILTTIFLFLVGALTSCKKTFLFPFITYNQYS